MFGKLHAQGNKFLLLTRTTLIFSLVYITTISAHAADLVFSPSTSSVEKGKSITVSVYVTNNTQSINAVSGTISYPSDTLSLTSISKSGSIIGLWPEEPSYSNAQSSAKFEGVILNPGFSDAKGKIVSLTFTAKQAGTANLSFSAGDVLANDGNASSVVGKLGTGTYTITVTDTTVQPQNTSDQSTVLTPIITSSTYPDENAWYNSRDAVFSWNLPSGVSAVRTLYDENSNSVPSKIYEPPIKTKSFTSDSDGIFYMHVQFKDAAGWGAVASRKFQIDTTSPTNLSVTFADGENITSTTPQVTITAQDKISGIDHYGISVDSGAESAYPVSPDNLYTMPRMDSGSHTVTVTAYDKAGNKTTTAVPVIITKLNPPIIVEYTKQTEVGRKVEVSGVSYPGKTIEVKLVDNNKNASSETVQVDSDGTFTLVWKDDLSAGVYEMSARVIDSAGNTSDWTDSRIIVLNSMKLVQVGMFVMNWLSLILILILSGMLALAVLWYAWVHFTRFRRKVTQTMKEAENTLKTNVQAFRRDTEEFHDVLQKVQKKRELTKEEAAILKKFKKRLDITEKEIEKKLEQIG